jgi:phosphoglycolate phosphatase
MIPIDAILFDLDGTLVDSRRDLAKSVRLLQKRFGTPCNSEEEVAAFVGDGVTKLVQRALPRLPPAKLEDAVAQFKRYYHDHCLDHTSVYPGVRETLRHFRRKKMAVVTNKPTRISGYILDRLDLAPFFAVLIGGDSLPNKKPHPEPVSNAMKTLRILRPKRVVMVGDGSNDVLAGRAAGTRTCGVRSNIGDPHKLFKSKPDFILDAIADLMRIFK